MRATVIVGPNKTDVIESATPAVGTNDILVKIRACGLCGS